MRLAQQLYEGVDVKDHGTVGLISYLRTDSVRVSEEADAAAKEFVRKNYGEELVTTQDVNKVSGKKWKRCFFLSFSFFYLCNLEVYI